MKILLVLICLSSNFEVMLNDFERTSWTSFYLTQKRIQQDVNEKLFDYKKYKEDSIIYSVTVLNFLNYDKSIIDSLLIFEYDTSRCFWIRTIHPHQGIIYPIDSLIQIKKIASLILIENYLYNNSKNRIIIPRTASKDKEIFLIGKGLYLLDYSYIKTWWENNKIFDIEVIRNNYKKDSLNHRYEWHGKLKKH